MLVFRVAVGVEQAHGGFFCDRPIYDVAGPRMLPGDAVGVNPRHAGSGPKSWGSGGALSSAISSDLRAV